uniref:Uncharacterized protein n=1 Tax=Anguilla anguilla TaxID=7936 RepID=A0A0E9XNR0_ANGAN
MKEELYAESKSPRNAGLCASGLKVLLSLFILWQFEVAQWRGGVFHPKHCSQISRKKPIIVLPS